VSVAGTLRYAHDDRGVEPESCLTAARPDGACFTIEGGMLHVESGAQIEAQERGVLAISSGMLCEGGLSAPQGAAVVLGGSTPKTFTTP